MISNGVDHAGLLLLMYPRPILMAAATLDFFPIEGTHKTFQEVSRLYSRFGHADRIAMAEGYHGHQYSDENQKAAFEFLDHFNRLPERDALASAKDLEGENRTVHTHWPGDARFRRCNVADGCDPGLLHGAPN